MAYAFHHLSAERYYIAIPIYDILDIVNKLEKSSSLFITLLKKNLLNLKSKRQF